MIDAPLFMLRVKLGHGMTLAVSAWEGAPFSIGPHHTRLDVRARLYYHDGKRRTYAEIFPRGATWCGIPGHQTIDGDDAKECVLSLLSIKPGDTDADYFKDYTSEQLDFVNSYGEELSLVALDRYGER